MNDQRCHMTITRTNGERTRCHTTSQNRAEANVLLHSLPRRGRQITFARGRTRSGFVADRARERLVRQLVVGLQYVCVVEGGVLEVVAVRDLEGAGGEPVQERYVAQHV